MKVLKNGNEKTYKATCGRCQSDLEYDLKDIQNIEYEYDDLMKALERKNTYTHETIICPVCRENIQV